VPDPDAGITRHDLSLAAIAVPLLVATVAGATLPVGLPVALGAGSVPASGGLGYALFYRPPGRE
jgi:hypothetical protein